MKISKKIFVLIVCLLATLCFNLDNVFANTDAEPGNTNNATTCSGGYCWSTDAGMRLTIVDEDGNRCKWDGSKIVCNASVSPTDSNSRSIDYWWNNEMGQHDYCFTMETKKTKKEFLKNKSNVIPCSTSRYYLNTLFKTSSYSDIMTENEPNAWKKIGGIEGYKNPTNIQSVINYLECKVRSKGATLFGKTTSIDDTVCGNVKYDKNYTILNNIFQN